jgi:CD80-like C2-set immunoglobulin domain
LFLTFIVVAVAFERNYTLPPYLKVLLVSEFAAEPQVLSLYLNNELQTQSLPGAANKKLFDINKVYNVSCVASGGNPFPNVTIYSGSKLLTPISITYNTTVSSPDVLGVVTRSTLVNVSIIMNVSHIGVPITCFAGLANPNGTSNAIIPISESGEFRFIFLTLSSLSCMGSTIFSQYSLVSQYYKC